MLLHESIVHYIGYIILGISVVLAIWTMVDAQKRDMDNPTKWFIIVLILNIIGLILYITQRPELDTAPSDSDIDEDEDE